MKQQKQQIIVHTHGYKAGIIARVFARLLGIPVISTYHSGDLGSGKLRVYSFIDHLTARLGDCIAVSDPIKAMLPNKAEMIPNFVEVAAPVPAQSLANFKQYLRNKTETIKPFQVAFVGRLSHEKGPDQFCAMAQKWQQQNATDNGQAVEFMIYGDGPDRDELSLQHQNLIRQGQLKFKGHVAMVDHWSDVDVLCISSRFEGLPYVALEAMARGIPVVSFAVGGMGDLISDSSLGWLVKAGDIEQLQQAITQWVQLPTDDKTRLGENVREKIRQNYSTSALVPRIEAFYRGYQ